MERATNALNVGTELVLRALVIQGIWVLGTLAGGIVLGWAPATMAAVDAAARAERGEPLRLGRAARVWRESFWRSQVTLGVPGLFLLFAVTAAMSSVLPVGVTVALGVVIALLAVAMLHIPDLDRRYALRATRVLARALLLGLAQAPTSVLLLAALSLWAAVMAALPGAVPFLGVSVPVLIAHHLVARSLDRNEDLLSRTAEPPTRAPLEATATVTARRPRPSLG